MVAAIARAKGRALAVYGAGTPAWHGLGEVVAGALTPKEAVTLAGTDYEVAVVPSAARINGEWVEDPSGFKTIRTDLGPTRDAILGSVSPDYKPIQNIAPMELLMQIVGTEEAGIVAHAALNKGERLFAVLDLRRLKDIKIPGDSSTTDFYLTAQWWHTGTGAFTVGPSAMRTECQNMANAQLVEAEGKGRLVRVAHVGDIEANMEEARRILGFAERKAEEWVDLMVRLAGTPITEPDWIAGYTEKVIPIPPEMERPALRLASREAIRSLYRESKTMVGVPETAYRAFQAVTEYADHYRPLMASQPLVAASRRFTSTVDGPAAEVKVRALRLLREEFEV